VRLAFPFIQLPLRFDAAALAAEVGAFDETEWRPHPQGFPGNSALPLVAVNGDPNNDGLAGPMRPTEYLARLPYLTQVLSSLGIVLGRTRLMRLSGQSEVSPHIDQAYYWAERMRVHVPIITQPGVQFYCGDAQINMAAGECWIFDTWRLHRVHNDSDEMRIHLVADTVGGDGFWELMTLSRPHHVGSIGWPIRDLPPQADTKPNLQFESVNTPRVMSPWELHSHLSFLFGEMQQHPALPEAHQATRNFIRRWQSLWSRYGDATEGFADYRVALDGYIQEMQRFREHLLLRNGLPFLKTATVMALTPALADGKSPPVFGEPRPPMPGPRAELKEDAEFDRPVFIVSPPRSGSTLLFETLAQAPGVYTIGSESHGIFEQLPSLHPAAHGFSSNRLDVDAATPEIAALLRSRFRARLVDRDGTHPAASAVRMLEKTPKNSLRVPFLAKVFPQAQFVYLYRDVRETLASMIEAWNSGHFRMYSQLPGWNGPPWSLLLTSGWQELVGKPLHEIVAAQWQATTQQLLDDLEKLPTENWCVARYDALLADPNAEIARLCNRVGFAWDRSLDSALPLSRHTVTPPEAQKWRQHEREIELVLPSLKTTIERAQRVAAR
jgi:sulfotransferase family protein/aspartyl/asparaginyl beta-hydroxylase